MSLPRRLAAPPSEWDREVDVLVIGAGVAGWCAALSCLPARSVLLVTKDAVDTEVTVSLDGALAVVAERLDLVPEDRRRWLAAAGGGLADLGLAAELAGDVPVARRSLRSLADLVDPDGPGHSLAAAALAGGVEVMGRTFALDLVVGLDRTGSDRCAGATVARTDANGAVQAVGTIRAHDVVLATGGLGQVYSSAGCPAGDSGDGVAMALRAGVAVTDLEFVGFEPLVMWRGPDAVGAQHAVPAALLAAGARLVDPSGAPLPISDLDDRTVCVTIADRLASVPAGVDDHVLLDLSGLAAELGEVAPGLVDACTAVGLDPLAEPIPVAPSAARSVGGIRADLDGRTSLGGLRAVGAVACTGVDGGDVSGGNDLLHAAVVGARTGRSLAWERTTPVRVPPGDAEANDLLFDPVRVREVRATMSRHVGPVRSAASLASATAAVGTLARSLGAGSAERGPVEPSRRSWEATNLLTVAAGVVAAASARPETCGGHVRSDSIDAPTTPHLDVVLDVTGVVSAQPDR
ncbi:MAG: FAD-binding protein [Actinomycetota bacterium]